MGRMIKVKEIAFARAGDKGDISNVGVIPYDEKNYSLLLEKLTVDKVKEIYKDLVKGPIFRYELPGIKSLNFVMHNALGGGITRSLHLDGWGRTRSRLLLDAEIEIE